MKALVCRAISNDLANLALEDVSLPPPGAEELRIRIRAAAVNFPDLLMVRGSYQHKPEAPFIVGGERAGGVSAVGDGVRGFAIGDRVMGGGLTGGFAEECNLSQSALRPIPDGIDFATAAAFTTAYLTAYVALERRAQLQTGEALLVHGAAGGIGLAAVDFGRAIGARVIATASTEEKRAFLAAYGVDHVLPSSGFREAVKDLTGSRGADVIFDPVGGDAFDESTRCIAFGGRLLAVGFASGRISSIGVNIPLIKGFSLIGVRAGEYGRRFPELGRENIRAIDRLLVDGAVRPHIGARFPLAGAVDAMRMLAERKIIGKAIVEP